MSGPCRCSAGSAASSACWGSGCLCRWAALTCCSCKLGPDAAERAGGKWEVGGCPTITQEMQLSSGSHFWSLPEFSFRDACPSHVLGRSWPWLKLKSSLQTSLAITGPWLTLSTIMGPALFSWLGYHGTAPLQWGDFCHLHWPSTSTLARSCCSLTLGSWYLHPRYATALFYSLQCRHWTKSPTHHGTISENHSG